MNENGRWGLVSLVLYLSIFVFSILAVIYLQRLIVQYTTPTILTRIRAPPPPATTSSASNETKTPICEAKHRKKDVVILLGDSVLDDFYWLQDPTQHLATRVRKLLPPDVAVVQLAVDQQTTFDFPKRCGSYTCASCPASQKTNGWDVYQDARIRHLKPDAFSTLALSTGQTFDDIHYPTDKDDHHHISIVERVRDIAREHIVRMIVLSIGGNDVYLRGDIQLQLLQSFHPQHTHLREQVASEFESRYVRVVDMIAAAAPNASIVPVIPYFPHRDFSLRFQAQKGRTADAARLAQWMLLSYIATPLISRLLSVAQARGLQVIDLSRTFDPTNASHYGTGAVGRKSVTGAAWSGAEPSNVSNNFTAQLIAHIFHTRIHTHTSTAMIHHTPHPGSTIVSETLTPVYISCYRFGANPVYTTLIYFLLCVVCVISLFYCL